MLNHALTRLALVWAAEDAATFAQNNPGKIFTPGLITDKRLFRMESPGSMWPEEFWIFYGEVVSGLTAMVALKQGHPIST